MNILICDNGLPFNLKTLENNSLGGSESSILLLSKGLSELGHNIVLLNNSNESETNNKIQLGNVKDFSLVAEKADIIVLNRFIPREIEQFKNKKIFYWCHDAYDQDNLKWMMNQNVWNSYINVLCVSEWQKNTLEKYFNAKNIKVLNNPIYSPFYYGNAQRNPNKLIFASIPYKGLEVIGDIFQEICIRSKRNLTLELFSSMSLYNRENTEYQNIYNKLQSIKGININEPISMKKIAYELSTSSLYIAPTTYHETFGRVFTESMAAGCIPVTVNNGANKEIINDNGFVVEGANINNLEVQNNFIDCVCSALEEDLYSKRLKAEDYSRKFDYLKIAKKFEEFI